MGGRRKECERQKNEENEEGIGRKRKSGKKETEEAEEIIKMVNPGRNRGRQKGEQE
jgi:hypothetical protein